MSNPSNPSSPSGRNRSPPPSAVKPPPPETEGKYLAPEIQSIVDKAVEAQVKAFESAKGEETKRLILWLYASMIERFAVTYNLESPLYPLSDPATGQTASQRLNENLEKARKARGRGQHSRGLDEDSFIVSDDDIFEPSERPETRDVVPRSGTPNRRTGAASSGTTADLTAALARVSIEPLLPLTVAYSPDYDIPRLTAIRKQFIDHLCMISIELQTNLNVGEYQFTQSDAHIFANLLFSNVFGPNGLHNLRAIILEYTTMPEDGIPANTATKARAVATDKTVPDIVRDFMKFFAAHAENQMRHTLLGKLGEIRMGLQMISRYQILISYTDPSVNGPLRQWLTANGYPCRRGRTVKSMLIQYLLATLNLDRKKFDQLLYDYNHVHELNLRFGHGIVVLLSPGILQNLKNFGKQKVQTAIRTFANHCAFYAEFCQLLAVNVVDPILHGEPLRLGPGYYLDRLQPALEDPILSRFAEAVPEDTASQGDSDAGVDNMDVDNEL